MQVNKKPPRYFHAIMAMLALTTIYSLLSAGCAKVNVFREPPDYPVIDSVAPASGKLGTQVRLYGTAFSTNVALNMVSVNGVGIRVDSPSSSTVVLATITAVTGTGHVNITVGNKEAAGPIFTYDEKAVSVNSISPGSGWVDTLVTIRGIGFGSSQDSVSVLFNGHPATIKKFSDTLIVVLAPDATNSAPAIVTVTVKVGGKLSNPVQFTYTNQQKPVIGGVVNQQWGQDLYYWIAVQGLSPQNAPNKISANGHDLHIDSILRQGTAEYSQSPYGAKLAIRADSVDKYLTTGAVDFIVTVNGTASDVYHFLNNPFISNITAPNRRIYNFFAGDTVTITGKYFGSQQPGSIVEIWYNHVDLVHLNPDPGILLWTNTQIQIVIPSYNEPDGTVLALYVKQDSRSVKADVTYQQSGSNDGGGIYVLGITLNQYATWKNGVPTILTDCNNAYSMYVAGSDVYVAGLKADPFTKLTKANYWKNGIAVDLTDAVTSAYPSVAYSIFVSGNDVYVAGNVGTATASHSNAAYWKNGVRVDLTDGSNDAYATSIFVSGNDVYVAGVEFKPITGNYMIALWKNGVRTNVTDGTIAVGTNFGSSLFVDGTDVYIAGEWIHGYSGNTYQEVAAYWKNGNLVNLSDLTGYALTRSIFVTGSDVYAAGQRYGVTTALAVYWKNGTEVVLAEGARYLGSLANSIIVSGTDVYVAGVNTSNSLYIGGYWKNGVFTTLESCISALTIVIH